MSRSNPTEDKSPNPAERWFEWNGQFGHVEWYDKDNKKREQLPLPFGFVLLDETETVRGWNDPNEVGIYSNEVKDLETQPLVVKMFKNKGTIASGFWSTIGDKVRAAGGKYAKNLYMLFKTAPTPENPHGLHLGVLQLTGAAVHAWIEFRKENKKAIYGDKAVRILSFAEGKKGAVKFRAPVFGLGDLGQQTADIATGVDKSLQAYFSEYFAKVPKGAPSDIDPEAEEPPKEAEKVYQRDEFGDPVNEAPVQPSAPPQPQQPPQPRVPASAPRPPQPPQSTDIEPDDVPF